MPTLHLHRSGVIGEPVALASVDRRPSVWSIPIGVVAWVALGFVARWWMRLITDEPEFTWSGTIFIVVAFGVTGVGHSIARVVRSRARRRWSTVARFAGGVLSLPLFVGAGAMMLPTVVGASLARWRPDWPRTARIVAALLAAPVPAFIVVSVVRERLDAGSALGLALFAGTYVVIVDSMRSVVAPLRDGWRMPTVLRWLLAAFGALVFAAVALAIVGIEG